jgi:hypothetical protein
MRITMRVESDRGVKLATLDIAAEEENIPVGRIADLYLIPMFAACKAELGVDK